MTITGMAVILLFAAALTTSTSAGEIPKVFTLRPEFERFGLTVRQQEPDACWAYTVTGCLEFEFSRAEKAGVHLSAPYLVRTALLADRDAVDPRGSNFGRAIRAMARYGMSSSPAPDTEPFRVPADAARRAGRIECHWVRYWRTPIGVGEDTLGYLKERIAEGHPIAIGMFWPNNLTVSDGPLCLLGTPSSIEETSDGHCVMLVGYEDDERFPGGGAFIIRNSWGDGWMSQGYARLSYEYVRRFGNDLVWFSVTGNDVPVPAVNGEPVTNLVKRNVVKARVETCKDYPSGSLSVRDMTRYSETAWMSGDQLVFSPKRAGDGLSITVDAPRAGRYIVSLAGTRTPDDGMYDVLLDGAPFGRRLDFAWPCIAPTGEIVLGVKQLSEGAHTLRLISAGKAPASHSLDLGLDWVSLRPAPKAAKR